MNVMFLVNGRWFKTLCKTVLEADTFDISISTEKHNIHACISEKCYFTSIDNYCLGYDTIDTIKTDFFISRNFKNTKDFLSKLDDTLATFLNTCIRNKHFCGNIDECIEKCLQDIKKVSENDTIETEVKRPKRRPITTDNDMNEEINKEKTIAKAKLNSAYGITAESVTPVPNEPKTNNTYEIRLFKKGAFICTYTFSLESFAHNAFKMIENSAIDFPEHCYTVIQLFKDGEPVKRSIIYFGEKLV